MEFEKITALLLKLNAHDKEFLSPPSMKMATERVTGFFLAYTHFFAFIRDYTPIFGKYFHGKVVCILTSLLLLICLFLFKHLYIIDRLTRKYSASTPSSPILTCSHSISMLLQSQIDEYEALAKIYITSRIFTNFYTI